jgi:PHD/YefM family antitoxin component YafN of YafNO toxin-antitoxin module
MATFEPMATATAADVQRDFPAWQERAMREPVAVVCDGEPQVVLVAATEYQRLRRRDRLAMLIEELDEPTLTALAATEPPHEAAAYDDEAA